MTAIEVDHGYIEFGTDDVIGVLLPDGWHEVRTFKIDPEPDVVRPTSGAHVESIGDDEPVLGPMFDLRTDDDRRLVGPVSSIAVLELAVDWSLPR